MELVIQRSTPDPYKPVVGFRLNAKSLGDLSRCSAQYRRRAEILAATRRLLVSEGHERFTIRSVSEACSLTAQTIHNSFGCKTDLLGSALNQHTVMIDSFALSQTKEPSVFIRLALAYFHCAMERPEFLRELVRMVFSPK